MNKIFIALLVVLLAVSTQTAFVKVTDMADWKGTFVVTKSSCNQFCGWKLGSKIVIAEKSATAVTWTGTTFTSDATNAEVTSAGICKYPKEKGSSAIAKVDVLKNSDECTIASGACVTMGQNAKTAANTEFKRDKAMATKPFQITYPQWKLVPLATTSSTAVDDITAKCITEANMVDTSADVKDLSGTVTLSSASCGTCTWDSTKTLKITQDSSKKYMVKVEGTLKESSSGSCNGKLTKAEDCHAIKDSSATKYYLYGCTTLWTPTGGIPVTLTTASGKTTLSMAWSDNASASCKVEGSFAASKAGSNAIKLVQGLSIMILLTLGLLFK
uniref:Immobilization antigen n=1 Tax=Cryptocaryon irritans TaxID=153251 RepID=A0AA48HPV3_9CILI|nr:immobilization antigen [Cryptocaryon irritans]